MVDIKSIRMGLKIDLDGELFVVNEFQHVSPGNKRAFVRAKIKNMKTGQVLEKTFRHGDPIREPDFEEKEMQYLYKDETGYHFMDSATYEQTFLNADQLGDQKKFIKENMEVKILYHNGQLIDIRLPFFAELEITETEPGFKGDTASGGSKPATLETGAVIQVPIFINVGDRVKVDTRSGEYMERVK
ncbi:MAG: elongation factor P [bacterium]|nr:MAG: elongation factor P [bacterium]